MREQDQVNMGSASDQAMKFLQNGAQTPEGQPPPQQPPVAPGQPTAPAAQPGLLAGAGAAPQSDQLTDQDLAAMGGGQDPQVQQVIAALEDPNTPPETKQAISTMLALAARRRMAGIQA